MPILSAASITVMAMPFDDGSNHVEAAGHFERPVVPGVSECHAERFYLPHQWVTEDIGRAQCANFTVALITGVIKGDEIARSEAETIAQIEICFPCDMLVPACDALK